MADKQLTFFDKIVTRLQKSAFNKRVRKIEQIYETRMTQIEMDAKGNNVRKHNGSTVGSKLNKLFLIVKRKLGLNRYYQNPYDFKSMRSAYENEAYVRRACDHYTETVMRNGYSITSENEDNALYIKRRLSEFEMVSSVSTEDNIRYMVPQMLLYGNLIGSLSRSENASSGDYYKRFDGKEMKPIAAMYVEDARSISIKNDKKRGLTYERSYERDFMPNSAQQNMPMVPGVTNFVISSLVPNGFSALTSAETPSNINKDDVLHIGFHRHSGDVWATPPFAPVMDDIRTLRSIEENVELLVFQYGHGILHGKVGDDKKDGTEPEIQNLKSSLEDMEANGFLVTDNRVELAIKGVEGTAVDVSKYLDYFKNRVFSGLYMSGVGMGEGDTANRNTADAVGKDSVDRTNELQRYISEFYSKVFQQLLLERGLTYKEVNDERNKVNLTFPEVDIISKIKVEEHYANMYVQNVITVDEARERMGFDQLDDTMVERMFNSLVTSKQTKEEGDIQKELIRLKPTTTGGGGATNNSGNKKTQGAIRKTNQAKRPVNQHGQKTAPTVSKK